MRTRVRVGQMRQPQGRDFPALAGSFLLTLGLACVDSSAGDEAPGLCRVDLRSSQHFEFGEGIGQTTQEASGALVMQLATVEWLENGPNCP